MADLCRGNGKYRDKDYGRIKTREEVGDLEHTMRYNRLLMYKEGELDGLKGCWVDWDVLQAVLILEQSQFSVRIAGY